MGYMRLILSIIVVLAVTAICYAQKWYIFMAHPNTQAITYNLASQGGAKCNGDAKNVTATITTILNSPTVTATTSQWVAGDAGKAIFIAGVGFMGATLQTTILTVNSALSITLATNALTAVSNTSEQMGWGSDDAPAFNAFNTYALANQGSPAALVNLVMPASGTCQVLTNINPSSEPGYNSFAAGVRNLKVAGNGSTITNYSNQGNFLQGSPIFFGAQGVQFSNTKDARLNTVYSGSTTLTLTNVGTPCAPTCQNLFTVGVPALIAGIDMQGFGDPANPYFYEWVTPTNIAGATITIASPLKYTYESTWPIYNPGDAFHSDNGGPATLYQLDPNWNAQWEYDNLTIDQASQTNAKGRSVTYNNVTFLGTSCGIPTENFSWTAINSNFSGCTNGGNGTEVDKINGSVNLSGGTFYKLLIQSASAELLSINGTTITNSLQGTPKKFTCSNTTLPILNVGALAYGRTNEVILNNCVVNSFGVQSVTESNTQTACTMVSGAISCSNSFGPRPWAIPGTNVFWRGTLTTEGIFQISDVTQTADQQANTTASATAGTNVPLTFSATPAGTFVGQYLKDTTTNTTLGTVSSFTGTTVTVGTLAANVGSGDNINFYGLTTIQTSLAGGFPALPGSLGVLVHPAPKFTCTNCSGADPQMASFNGAPAAAPLYSYQTYTYGGALGTAVQPTFTMWGNIQSLSYNVTNAYNATLSWQLSQFNNWTVINSLGGTASYGPAVNAQIAGNRVVTLTGVSGTQSGDSGLASPDFAGMWFGGQSNSGPQYQQNASGACPGANCPSVTLTMQTNQGVINPPQVYYYVSTSGSDSNNGLSPATAWLTPGKITSFTFPGTQDNGILFQGGQSFTGCSTLVGNSNAKGPGSFYIGNYGGGQATITAAAACDGATGTDTAVLNINGVSNITVDKLILRGDGGGTKNGILLQNGLGDTQPASHDVVIKNNDISGFNSEINFIGLANDAACPPVSFNFVTFFNNTLHGASNTSADSYGISGHGCQNNPTWPPGSGPFNMYNVVYRGNTITNLGGVAGVDTTGVAIDCDGINGCLIEHNLVHDIGANSTTTGGPAGLEAFTATNVMIRSNEVHDVVPSSYTTGGDWDGIDCDGGVTNCIVEYNYTHHNWGQGILAFAANSNSLGWGPMTVRYNISENDAWGFPSGGGFAYLAFSLDSTVTTVNVYNNTFWEGLNGGQTSAPFYFSPAVPDQGVIANNVGGTVTSTNTGTDIFIAVAGTATRATSTLVYKNNAWYNIDGNGTLAWELSTNTGTNTTETSLANWKAAAPGGDTSAFLSNPLFVSGGSGGTCTWTPSALTGPQPCPANYGYQAGSPLKNVGIDMTGTPFFFSTGGFDYYGNANTHVNMGHYMGL